jgi:hypothetical protein
MQRRPRLPRDINQRAFAVVAALTGTALPEPQEPEKDPAAVSFGRRGGLKGGHARAIALSAERRSELARNAALVRWKKSEKPKS